MLFDALSTEDKEKISCYIANHAFIMATNNGDKPEDLRKTLQYWNENKINLFEKFGNKFILEKEIEFDANENEIAREIGGELHCFEFVYALEKVVDFYQYCDLTHPSALYKNIYDGPTFYINLPSGKPFKVQYGCKLNKLFGKLTKEFNLPGYTEFSNWLSQKTNQRKIKGKLCLSIHPLDYFTLSDNKCGWTSCLSWQENGGYSVGPVAAMNDPCLVVAYLKSSTDMFFGDNMRWNSKRWREIFIVDKGFITGIKGYPYQHEMLEKMCLDWIAEILGGEFEEEYLAIDRFGRVMYPVKYQAMRLNFNFAWLYDDFARCPHTAKIHKSVNPETYFSNTYAEILNCPYCGEIYIPEFEGQRVCHNCEHIYYCEDCGEPLTEYEVYMIGDTPYCSDCYNNQDIECCVCGGCYSPNDVVYYPVQNEQGQTEDQYICHECLKAFENTEEI